MANGTSPATRSARGWSASAVATHAFPKPGRYKVILKVRDKRWHTTSRTMHTLQVGDPRTVKATAPHGKGDTTTGDKHGKGVH